MNKPTSNVINLNLNARLYNEANSGNDDNDSQNAPKASLFFVYCDAYPDGCLMTIDALRAYKRLFKDYVTAVEVPGAVAVELVRSRNTPTVFKSHILKLVEK